MTVLFDALPALAAAGGAAGGASGGLGSVLAAAGSVASAFGAFKQGQAAQTAANYNAQINLNAANSAEVTGQQEAGRLYDINRRKMATAQNQMGASGALLDIGSPVDVMADLAGQAALDEEIARWRGRVAATGYRNEANAQTFAGQQAYKAGLAKAGTMLLSGFGRVGGGASSASVDPWANVPGQAGWY